MVHSPQLSATWPPDACIAVHARRRESSAGPGRPLRAGGQVTASAHLAVLLFATLFLGVFAVAWPFAEASVDRCERARCPGARYPTIMAATRIPPAEEPPAGDPTSGLGDGWLLHGRRHRAVDPLQGGSSRLLRRLTPVRDRSLDRSMPGVPSSTSPHLVSSVGRVVTCDAPGRGVSHVQTSASRGPPRRGLRRPDVCRPRLFARSRAAGGRSRPPASPRGRTAANPLVPDDLVQRARVHVVRHQLQRAGLPHQPVPRVRLL